MPEKLLIIAQADVSRKVLDAVRKNASKSVVLSAKNGLLLSIPSILHDDENGKCEEVTEIVEWARSRATAWLWLVEEKS